MATPAEEPNLHPLLERVRDASGFIAVESSMRLGEMPALHCDVEDEAFVVLEGTLTLHSGGEVVRLDAGESFVVPRGTPHTYCAESARVRYRAATLAASVGRYEDFLRAVGRPVSEDWAESPEAAALGAIAGANGITVLGPPGALP